MNGQSNVDMAGTSLKNSNGLTPLNKSSNTSTTNISNNNNESHNNGNGNNNNSSNYNNNNDNDNVNNNNNNNNSNNNTVESHNSTINNFDQGNNSLHSNNDQTPNIPANIDTVGSTNNGYNLNSPDMIKIEDGVNVQNRRPTGLINHPTFNNQASMSGHQSQLTIQLNPQMSIQPHMVNAPQFLVNGAVDQQMMMNGAIVQQPQQPQNTTNGVRGGIQPNKIGQYGPMNILQQGQTFQIDPNFSLQQQKNFGNLSGPVTTPGSNQTHFGLQQPQSGDTNSKASGIIGKRQFYNRPMGQSPLYKPMTIATNPTSREQELFQQEINAKLYKRNFGNAGMVRLLDLIDQISNESIENLSNIEYWQLIIQLFFLPNSIFNFNIVANQKHQSTNNNTPSSSFQDREDAGPENHKLPQNEPNLNEKYELNSITAPRFLVASIIEGNIQTFNLSLQSHKYQVLSNGSLLILSRVSTQYTYKDESLLTVMGNLKVLMNREFRIEFIDVKCFEYYPSYSFSHLEKRWQRYLESSKYQKFLNSAVDMNDFFNEISTNSEAARNAANAGISSDSLRVMQLSDVMSLLQSLMRFSSINNVISPLKALDMFMELNSKQKLQHQTSGVQLTITNQKKNSVSSVSPLTTFSEDVKTNLKRRKQSMLGSTSGSPLTGSDIKETKFR